MAISKLTLSDGAEYLVPSALWSPAAKALGRSIESLQRGESLSVDTLARESAEVLLECLRRQYGEDAERIIALYDPYDDAARMQAIRAVRGLGAE